LPGGLVCPLDETDANRFPRSGEGQANLFLEMLSGAAIRTVELFDWEKQVRTWFPDRVEARTEGHVYI
jgi:hypothetical protein